MLFVRVSRKIQNPKTNIFSYQTRLTDTPHRRRGGGHSRAVPPKRVTVPPTFHHLSSLLNMIDFESESETDKTAHIRKQLHALVSVSNCTRSQMACFPPESIKYQQIKINKWLTLLEILKWAMLGSSNQTIIQTQTSKTTQRWFTEHITKLLLWSFQCSDLNPVEHEWSELKRRSTVMELGI